MSLELIESAELCDLGLKRKNNEDACLRLPDKGLFCVADGMGGVVGGDLASQTIIANVQEAFEKAAPEQYSTLASSAGLLGAAVNKASKWIKDFADEKVIGQMGSTLVGLVFDPRNPSRAVVLHAGDSRLYRWRAGRLEQLTADHTAAAALSATLGRDPSSFPARFHNELARAVGLKESVELEESKVEARTGDVFLLCSDGLPRMVPDQDISQVLAHGAKEDLAALSRALIQKANEAGGRDNVTVVLVRVGDISRFANVPPEPETQPRRVAPMLVSEKDSSRTDRDVHSPPTPDTVRDDQAYTQIRPTTPAPPPRVPPVPVPSASPPVEPPRPKPRARRRGPVIVGTLVVLAAGIMAFLYLPGKSTPTPGPSIPTNLPSPDPARDAAVPPTKPIAPKPIVVTPPPPPPTGALVIQSDPVGVDVYSNGLKVGQTPYEMNGLQPGPLVYQLGNLVRTGMVTITVVAAETNRANVSLAHRTGTLVVTSDPPNAQVWVGDKSVGRTPFSNNWEAGDFRVALKLPPYQEIQWPLTLAADTMLQTNVAFAYGGVKINSDPAGAEVFLNGKAIGPTPFSTNLLLPGPMSFQLKLTNYEPFTGTVQVPGDRTFAEKNIPLQHVLVVVDHPVVVSQVVPTNVAGTGRVWTNQDKVVWTNRYGMPFLKLPTHDIWIQMARVTPRQFNEVDGDNKQLIPEVPLDRAESFATKLTAVVHEKNEFPAGCESWRFAIPTPEEWLSATNVMFQEMKAETGHEWCWKPDTKEMFAADYNMDRKKFMASIPLIPSDVPPNGWALRLVLVPPGPAAH